MRLRMQLIIINLLSVAILVVAVVYSYSIMLLNLNQARILTGIAIGAGVVSSLLYWFLTVPITASLKRLMDYANEVGDGRFETTVSAAKGPYEVRQLSQSIQEMNRKLHENFQQLETMERTRRELIANVSHDLRTPLASVQSYVEALDDGVIEDSATAHVYLTTIQREVQRLGALIEDLFELSKLEAGQQAFQPVKARVDGIVLEVLESCKVRIFQKKLHVDVHMDDDIPAVSMMPDKIVRVFNNLLDNAIRHSPDGGTLEVSITRTTDEGWIEVSVRDEGEGIAQGDEDLLFERFFRSDKSRQRQSGGAGLGLAIAKSLIDLHGGKIGVRVASPGAAGQQAGSEFWFRLPA